MAPIGCNLRPIGWKHVRGRRHSAPPRFATSAYRGDEDMRRYSKTTAAYYELNQFLIRMTADFPFLKLNPESGELEPSDDNFDVFLHEYTHYWHNISTLAGVRSLVTFLGLTRFFAHTLTATGDGRSSGSGQLDTTLRDGLRRMVGLSRRHVGSTLPADGRDDGEGEVVVASFTDKRPSGVCDEGSSTEVIIELDVHGEKDTRQTTFILGARAIDESLAHLFEHRVARIFRGEPLKAPEFPYRIVERITEKYLNNEATDHRCAVLGTLALLTPSPGPSLILIMERCRNAIASAGECDAEIEAIGKEVGGWFAGKLPDFKATLENLKEAYKGRAYLLNAVTEITDIYGRALDARAANPLLYVNVFYPDVNLDRLAEHTRDLFPTCDFVQEHAGDVEKIGRDWIHTVRDAPPQGESEISTFFRMLHAQTRYSQAHLRGNEFVKSAETEAEDSGCPFYTCCDKEPRQVNGEACRNAPWTHYSQEAEKLC